MSYEYVTSLNRYRSRESGTFVSRATVMGYVDRIIDAGGNASDTLAALWGEGALSPADFGLQMRDELRSSYLQQYILGRGGRDQMTPSDWGSVGRLLRDQYRFLDGFVADLEMNERSEEYVRNRARLYFMRSREAYERGNARAFGVPRLPAYPCDLSSECKAGDRCAWDIIRLDGSGNYDCYWRTQPGETCPTCVDRGAEWSPLMVREGVLLPYRDIRAEAHYAHTHDFDEVWRIPA